ncbi:hypothetical protein Franean1_1055 [Parafrankia sp. EAN1pec]|nr:hypothetical protein Franean1_1055 [Frankia sp. EAN1pec]
MRDITPGRLGPGVILGVGADPGIDSGSAGGPRPGARAGHGPAGPLRRVRADGSSRVRTVGKVGACRVSVVPSDPYLATIRSTAGPTPPGELDAAVGDSV